MPRKAWLEWADRHLLMVGATLILAGIVFSFAYNWESMSRLGKLSLAAAAIVVSAAAAQLVGRDKTGGKVLVLAASVLVGVLLAVFGQAYQTGADAYELFTGWAALIFLWVLISRFAALWMVWLVVVHCAAIFYWVQVLEPGETHPFDVWFLGLACVDVVALALRELAVRRRGIRWIAAVWFQGMLLSAALFFASLPALAWIFDASEDLPLGAGSVVLWLAGVGGGFYVYRFVFREVLPLSCIVLDVCIVVCSALIHGIFEDRAFRSEGPWILSGLIVLLVVGVAAVGLKYQIAAIRRELQDLAVPKEAA